MKTQITREGRLIVSAENDLEAFALDAWWQKYKSSDSVLRVDTETYLASVAMDRPTYHVMYTEDGTSEVTA
jgi:hypothetical protein